jgi:dihydropyrimidinase
VLDLVIRGGQVVTPQGAGMWDIGVQGERIAAIATPGSLPAEGRVIDATGKIVVPGGVEPHTHLAHFVGMFPDEQFHTLGPEEDTRGMVFGGTTTHVDFCFIRPNQLDLGAAIEQRAARWKANSYNDYTFHVALQGKLPIRTFDQIPEAIQQGFPSFKVFTVNVLPEHPKRPPYRLDFGRIGHVMQLVRDNGGLMVVHAEDEDLVQFNYEKFREDKRMEGENLPYVHTKLSEKLAFRRTITLAEATGAAVYFVHTSALEGVEAVREGRAKGLPIYAETLHHYACFSADDYKKPQGFCYHTYPSAKWKEDQDALWSGLVTDGISATATDEFPTSLELKLRGKTIEDVTGGNLGAEAVTSSNVAKILGLYPKKGALAPGSDADIVFIDPSIRRPLTKADFHVSDYSPWEGWNVLGWPVTTILRGKVIVADGKLHGTPNDGQLVKRRIAGDVLSRPVA